MDILIKSERYSFKIRVVGLIVDGGKVLLQKKETDIYWSLPGGKMCQAEMSKETLKREIMEEIGCEIEIKELKCIVENVYTKKDIVHHEIGFVYMANLNERAEVANTKRFRSIEDEELEYEWFELDNLNNFRPLYLKELLVMGEGCKHIQTIDDNIII